jgi:anti-sigma regulatory factor (Ser/Thr protein kinase)
MRLAIHQGSLSYARWHARRVMEEFGRHELIGTAQLIVTELVTNAIKAMVGYYDRADPEDDDQEALTRALRARCDETIQIDVYPFGDSMVVAVWDSCRTPPKLREAGDDDVGGRGLRLVNELAAEWSYRWPKTGGKVVWARLTSGGLP